MLKRELDRGINSKLQQRVKSLEQKINNIKMSIQHIKTDNEHVSQSASGLHGTSTSQTFRKIDVLVLSDPSSPEFGYIERWYIFDRLGKFQIKILVLALSRCR